MPGGGGTYLYSHTLEADTDESLSSKPTWSTEMSSRTARSTQTNSDSEN